LGVGQIDILVQLLAFAFGPVGLFSTGCLFLMIFGGEKMMKCAVIVCGLGAVAGLAGAEVASQGAVSHEERWLAGTTIDISGLSAYDGLGQSVNQVLNAMAFPNSDIHGIGWNLQVETIGDSWLSDLRMQFRSSNGESYDTALFGNDGPGQGQSYVPLVEFWGDLGFHFLQGQDGVFEVELYDTFVDNPGGAEATLMDGSVLYIQYWVPSPGTLALFGAGGLMAARRRR
jgi:hypothetical protein